ncbi:hypothetical protein CgunFtcFv8_008059 [Champsocephalus gunnari]|uniref:Uncharacterized protein n=1 Tax=Champsocephalus gunnari TaxID=52237 RepID=A0AAN8HF92_CHAGU|nr:hypothetical protein CgunFtcFv8_008059 [Champsocephalus gunnari]
MIQSESWWEDPAGKIPGCPPTLYFLRSVCGGGGSDLSTPKDRPVQSDEDEGSDMESETYENDQSPGKGQAKTLQKKKQARGRNKEEEKDNVAPRVQNKWPWIEDERTAIKKHLHG